MRELKFQEKLEIFLLKHKILTLLLGGLIFHLFHITMLFFSIEMQFFLPIILGMITSFLLMKILQKNKELLELSKTDHLTQILNRRSFESETKDYLAYHSRKNKDSVLAIIDIDLFKSVNDNCGHHIGDFVLKTFSKTILKNLRQYDIFGRVGGEEFTIYFPDSNLQDVKHKCNQLRNIVEKKKFICANNGINITASFGLASSKVASYNYKRLYQMADEALYSAKKTGRNKVCIYNYD